MADGQISFHYMNESDEQTFGGVDGAVIISKRDALKQYGDIFVDLDNVRWKIKPKYEWEEFKDDFDEEMRETVSSTIESSLETLLLKYFKINKEVLPNEELQLNIWAIEDSLTIPENSSETSEENPVTPEENPVTPENNSETSEENPETPEE